MRRDGRDGLGETDVPGFGTVEGLGDVVIALAMSAKEEDLVLSILAGILVQGFDGLSQGRPIRIYQSEVLSLKKVRTSSNMCHGMSLQSRMFSSQCWNHPERNSLERSCI